MLKIITKNKKPKYKYFESKEEKQRKKRKKVEKKSFLIEEVPEKKNQDPNLKTLTTRDFTP